MHAHAASVSPSKQAVQIKYGVSHSSTIKFCLLYAMHAQVMICRNSKAKGKEDRNSAAAHLSPHTIIIGISFERSRVSQQECCRCKACNLCWGGTCCPILYMASLRCCVPGPMPCCLRTQQRFNQLRLFRVLHA